MIKFHNLGVAHGIWGECIAREYLRKNGFEILEVNSRPYKKDKRLEIDIVAVDKKNKCLVFLEVKQHNKDSQVGSERMRAVDKRKIANIRRAAIAWRWKEGHQGDYRFDVLQIYGAPDIGVKRIIHTKDVMMFVKPDRYVNWS